MAATNTHLQSFQCTLPHPGPMIHEMAKAPSTEECCTLSHDMSDFCCSTVEPSSCCGPQSHMTLDSLDCCTSPHTPTINGFTMAEIECCIMDSAIKEGMDSDCCQDLVHPGAIVTRTTCCSEHPEVINDCCLTCCPETLAPASASPSSGSSLSSLLTPTLGPASHYFPLQHMSWNGTSACTHTDDHSSHRSGTHSAFHFLSAHPATHTHEAQGHTTPSHLSASASASATPASLPLSPASMDEAQIDHMIRCLWTGCTAEFMKQDDLLPHLSQLHVPFQQSDHALCLWESCATEQSGGDRLLEHLRADHHIIPDETTTALGSKSGAGLSNTVQAAASWAGGDSTDNSASQDDEVQHRCRWKGCHRSFPNFDSLTSHLSEDHIGMGKSVYICEWEGCERNRRGFGQRQKAMRHIQTHTGDKPYQCQICRKRFSEANIMAQHMRTHTGEKPFKCPEPGCGREFSISGALTIHRRVHTGEKPFKCKFEGCDKWFAESSNLTKHLRVHTGERPFQCPHLGCEKRFSRPDQVTRHRRTHMTPAQKAAEKAAAATTPSSSSAASGSNKSGKRTAVSLSESASPSSSPEQGFVDEFATADGPWSSAFSSAGEEGDVPDEWTRAPKRSKV